MMKIAVGAAARGVIDLSQSATWNMEKIAKAKTCKVNDLTVVILNRPRHKDLIVELRSLGCRIRLIEDGDVSAAIAVCEPDSGIDVLIGTGGAPEGVIAAAALRCMGGELQGKLVFRTDDERARAKSMGVSDLDKVYAMDELAKGRVMFTATGVTTGAFLKGVNFFPGGCVTHSIVMRSQTGTVRLLTTRHHFGLKPDLAKTY